MSLQKRYKMVHQRSPTMCHPESSAQVILVPHLYLWCLNGIKTHRYPWQIVFSTLPACLLILNGALAKVQSKIFSLTLSHIQLYSSVGEFLLYIPALFLSIASIFPTLLESLQYAVTICDQWFFCLHSPSQSGLGCCSLNIIAILSLCLLALILRNTPNCLAQHFVLLSFHRDFHNARGLVDGLLDTDQLWMMQDGLIGSWQGKYVFLHIYGKTELQRRHSTNRKNMK